MLKLAVLILLIMLIYAGLYSVISIIKPEVIVGSTIKGAVSKTLDEAQYDGYLKAFLALCRDAGIFGLAATISGLFILFTGFRKAYKWAWFAFLIGGGIAWLGGLILAIFISDFLNTLIRLVGTGLSVLGLFLPVQVFFGKKQEETETTV
jgi:hypothetical protein